jgi:hypothetical protein
MRMSFFTSADFSRWGNIGSRWTTSGACPDAATSDGQISNVYSLTVRNLDSLDHTYRLNVSGLPGLSFDQHSIAVPAGESRQAVITVKADPDVIEKPSHSIVLTLEAEEDGSIHLERDTRFIGNLR